MKFKQFLAFLLLVFSAVVYAQLPVPAYIGSAKFSGKGSGPSGNPTINFTIPNGTTNKNRMMIITMAGERNNAGGGTNFFSNRSTPASDYGNAINLPDVYVNGVKSTNEIGYHSNVIPNTTTPTDLQNWKGVAWSYKMPDSMTGTLPITFQYLPNPQTENDEISFIISVYENVKSSQSINDSKYFGFANGTTALTPTLGRTAQEIMYMVNGGITYDTNLTLSSGWTIEQFNKVTNNGAPWSFAQNENDGIAHIVAHQIGITGNPSAQINVTGTLGYFSGGYVFHGLLPLASPSVTGKVVTPTLNSATGTQGGGLWMNVVDKATNKVVAVIAIDGSGNFTIPNGTLLEGENYDFILSKNAGFVGTTNPIAVTLNTGWITMAEGINGATPDSNANSIVNMTIGATNITGLKFAIKTIDPCNALESGNKDSDGDGISDICDLDSDNDGILDTVECPSTELVNNGTFTGNANGWTLEGAWKYVSNRVENDIPVSGARLLQSVSNLDKVKSNVVPLTLTVGAQDASQSSGNTSALEIRINGILYATLNNSTVRDNSNVTIALEDGVWSNFIPFGTNGVNGYNTKTFTLWIPYSGPATADLVFTMMGGNDDWSIDNVSVPAMICDKDGDGIPNYLDLDSDGDGCTDAIEGGTNFTTSNLQTANGTIASQTPNQNLGNTVGNTSTTLGVPTIAGTGQSVGQSQDFSKNDCLDIDGDGVPDWKDLDNDNDGILDINECTPSELVTNGTFTGNTNGWEMHALWNHDSVRNIMYIDANNVNRTLWQTLNPLNLFPNNIIPVTFTLGAQDEGNAAGEKATLQIKLSGVVYATITNGTDRSNSNVTISIENGATTNFVSFGTAGINNYATHTFTIWIPYTYTGSTTGDLSFVTVSDASNYSRDNWSIDNVSIVGMLCDTDQDGIPDHLDLDSDGDGCTDAIEGGANFTNVNLQTATGSLASQTPNKNLGNTVDASGVPTFTTPPIGYINGSGQTFGNSKNSAVNDCVIPFCYKPGILDTGNTYPTQQGITALGRAGANNGNWPMVRQSAWTALESKEKGFVVNRVIATVDLANITNPVEGMMIYDTEAKCMKVYTLKSGDTAMAWHCMITPACPD